MKKAILIICITFLFSSASFSQMTLASYDGFNATDTEQIFDGDILVYEQVGEVIYFSIENSSSDPINVKIEAEKITNTDGSEVQFCIGSNCLIQINEGVIYPISGNPIVVPAGGNTMQALDHFQNDNPGDGTNYPMDYTFRFFQIDENENEIGNSITFTYRFDPTLSNSNFQLSDLGVYLNNTLATGDLSITAKTPVTSEIYDLQGKLIQTANLTIGNSMIDVNSLKSGLYIIAFADDKGNRATTKFIKK